MAFAGLPAVAGPGSVRCDRCGIVRVPVDERGEGWG